MARRLIPTERESSSQHARLRPSRKLDFRIAVILPRVLESLRALISALSSVNLNEGIAHPRDSSIYPGGNDHRRRFARLQLNRHGNIRHSRILRIADTGHKVFHRPQDLHGPIETASLPIVPRFPEASERCSDERSD